MSFFQDELLVRQQRQIDRRVTAATFRELKPLNDFDWLILRTSGEDHYLVPAGIPKVLRYRKARPACVLSKDGRLLHSQ